MLPSTPQPGAVEPLSPIGSGAGLSRSNQDRKHNHPHDHQHDRKVEQCPPQISLSADSGNGG